MYKRKVEQLEKDREKDQCGINKKAKTVKRKVQPKMEIAGTWAELREAFKKDVYPHHKFMRNESVCFTNLRLHLQIEAMKIAIRAAFDHFSDPDHMQIGIEELLDTQSLARAAQTITDQATTLPPHALPATNDTVYLCSADDQGNMVSLIQSNYMAFGSGIVIPGTGIAMQNRGAGFTLQSGHPNEVGPAKRPFHTIIPGFVSKDGQPDMAFGVMGGHMQAQGHVQMVTRIYSYQQNPQAASDAPRWIVNPDFSVGLERGTPDAVVAELSRRGHRVSIDPNRNTFGGAQLIKRYQGGYIAGSDHRKEGLAAGF